VTKIELFGEPDFVLQTLFDLYTNTGGGAAGGDDVLIVEEDEGQSEEQQQFAQDGEGEGETGKPDPLPPHALVLSFQRGQSMAQLPQELRNMILELYLGNGSAGPSHVIEGLDQGQGAKPPAEPQSEAIPFQAQAVASTLVVPPAPGAAADDRELELAGAALAGAALSLSGRNVRTFDPASGRFTEHRAEARGERVDLDRARFVGTGIDW
jgi:hypothetical protein